MQRKNLRCIFAFHHDTITQISKPLLSRKDETYDMKTNNQSNIFTHPFVMTLLATICCLLWGSAFPAIKLGYQWFDIAAEATGTQILFAGWRFTLAGILTIMIGSILTGRVLLPKKESLKKIAILSIFQTSLHYFCFYVGLAHTTGVKTSILNGISVFVAILIAALVFKQEKLTAVKLLGSILGFCGIVLVNLTGAGLDFNFQMRGEGMIVLSTVCYGISSALILKESGQNFGIKEVIALVLIAGGIFIVQKEFK